MRSTVPRHCVRGLRHLQASLHTPGVMLFGHTTLSRPAETTVPLHAADPRQLGPSFSDLATHTEHMRSVHSTLQSATRTDITAHARHMQSVAYHRRGTLRHRPALPARTHAHTDTQAPLRPEGRAGATAPNRCAPLAHVPTESDSPATTATAERGRRTPRHQQSAQEHRLNTRTLTGR